MQKNIFKTIYALLLISVFNFTETYAQGVPQGFNYQAIARDATNLLVTNHAIGIKIGIYAGSANGTLEWEETHTPTSNQFGLFTLVIGQGTSTGNGSIPNFSSINWGAASHYLKVSMDITGGSNYIQMDNSQLLSVPYAFYSAQSGSVPTLSLNDLVDADTAGVSVGKTLKWNGINWVPAKDNNSDTASYAYNSYHSTHSDTANYVIHTTPADTALYAYHAGSALFTDSAGRATNAFHANHSDTATFALNCGNTSNDWHLGGNSGTSPSSNFIGTSDSVDLIIKTNNQERLRVTALGKIGIGTSTPIAALHIISDDGVIAQGTLGAGLIPATGAGTRMMWYPKKAAFRSGTVTGVQWDDASIGNYSFANGYNCRAQGVGSVAVGQSCYAGDSGAVALGYTCVANRNSSVCIGNGSTVSGVSGVSIGRADLASGYAAVAIGYHSTASGNFATAIGDHNVASGNYSTTLGYFTSSNGHAGSFIFADVNTNLTVTNNTADNQFLVKATGGTYFYTNSALTSGVSLSSGGGGWNILSNKHMKENFKDVDGNEILRKLAEMPVTSWNYKSQSQKIRHIGPMAQDFYGAFGFGESDTTITSVDIDGINMVAIKALIEKTNELKRKAKEIEDLKATVEALKKNNSLLEARIESMETTINRKFKVYSLAPAGASR
ncbi:MAG: tail fiber domain-containing protein [Bacteroidota bacterium]